MDYSVNYTDKDGKLVKSGKRITATILPHLVATFAKPKMVVAEVGVWEGNSLDIYIETIKSLDGKLYLIDWWKGSTFVEEGLDMSYNDNIYEDVYQKVLDIIDAHDAHSNVIILKGDSVEMAKQIPDASLDLCFIDAGHTYQECKRDIEAYLPKVKKGGIIGGDDMDNVKSFYEYLIKLFTYSPEDRSKDAVSGQGHPGVHTAVWNTFNININTFSDAWYTFVGYHFVRGSLGIVEQDDYANFISGEASSAEFRDKIIPFEAMHVLDNTHNYLIPLGWGTPSEDIVAMPMEPGSIIYEDKKEEK